MKVRLGIITSQIHMNYLTQIQKEFDDICEMKFFISNSLKNIDDIFTKNYNLVDAFILSGPIVYLSLSHKNRNSSKPIYILNDYEASFYKEFTKILINNPNIDFSRIYIDFIFLLNNFEDFKDIFPVNQLPYFLPTRINNIKDIPELILNNHINLWEENKIDFSITSIGHLIPELNKRGIKNYFITPQLDYAINIFQHAINETTISKLNNQKTVVGYITINSLDENNEIVYYKEYEKLTEAIIYFFKEYNFNNTVQFINNHIEIYTIYQDFLAITNNVKNCALIKYISDSTSIGTIKLGWGSGNELYQARENAIKANRQAEAYNGSSSFFINDEQKVIGPLQGSKIIEFYESARPEILELSNKLEVNNINIQKIISYANRTKTNKFCSTDISECLSITVRGANRILNKIEEKGYSNIVFEKRENTKGRPKKYYELVFLDENGNSLI